MIGGDSEEVAAVVEELGTVVCVDEDTVSELLELRESAVGVELKVEDSVVTVE